MGNERQKSTVSNSKASKVKKEETDSDDDFMVSKASKVRKEETDSDDDFKPKSKKSASVSNAKASKVKKIKNEDLEDDIKDEKKRKKKEGIKEAEKKAPREKGKVKKERKVYELPGQKHDPPAERDPLRIFYESLYEQVPTSEMAAIWMMEWGLLPLDVARKVFEKKQGQKMKSPVKNNSSKRNTASPAKKTPLLSTKKTSSASKVAVKAITQRKRRANSDSDDDDDEFTISRIKAKRQKISS